MFISLAKLKKPLLASLALMLLATSFLAFVPAQPAQAASQQSKNRRYVAALARCLIVGKDHDGSRSTIDDVFGNGTREIQSAVVGFDLDQTNGVLTCGEVVTEAGRILGNTDGEQAALDWLEAELSPDDRRDKFSEYQNGAADRGEVNDQVDRFVEETLVPYVNAIPITDPELAERLLPLADICYGFNSIDYEPSDIGGSNGIAGKNGTLIYGTRVDPSLESLAARFGIDEGGSNIFRSSNASIGDVELGFNTASGFSSTTSGGYDGPYTSDFYAFGADNLDIFSTRVFNQGHAGGVAQDCTVVENVAERIFPQYTIDENGVLSFNGLTAEDVVAQGEVDLNIALSGTNDNPTCESQGVSLSWLFCPIINGALDSMDWMFRQFIEPFLLTQPLTTNEGDLVYDVWKSFRTLGNILLLFALLFIVFGQTIGGGLVDAYTAKKAMPRVLAAAIFINLSYFGVALMVDMFNIIGSGVGQLISAPIGDQGSFNFTPNNFVNAGGLLAIVLGGNFVISLLASSGFLPLLMLTVFLPMMLVVVGIFGTLIIRRGIIIALVVVAPIAAALFVLPNTEKYAKQWFSLLIKTLMVYPIIMAIFAIADLLSVMLLNANSNSGNVGGFAQDSLSQFVGMVVLFIPFFLIPFSFKFAGGAIASISGAITNAGKKGTAMVRGSEHDVNSRISKARKGTFTMDANGNIQSHRQSLVLPKKVAKRMSNYKKGRSSANAAPGATNAAGGVGPNLYGPSKLHQARPAPTGSTQQGRPGGPRQTGQQQPPQAQASSASMPAPTPGTVVAASGPAVGSGTQQTTSSPPPAGSAPVDQGGARFGAAEVRPGLESAPKPTATAKQQLDQHKENLQKNPAATSGQSQAAEAQVRDYQKGLERTEGGEVSAEPPSVPKNTSWDGSSPSERFGSDSDNA